MFGGGGTGGEDGSAGAVPERKAKHRSYSDLPGEVKRLLRELTHRNASERTSVRSARLYPWIDDVLVDRELPWGISMNKVKYLSFILAKEGKGDQSGRADEENADDVDGGADPEPAAKEADERGDNRPADEVEC